MLELFWLVPVLPLAGFLVLAFLGTRLPRKAVASVGVGSIGLSALVAILVSASFLSIPPEGEGYNGYTQILWTWVNVSGFSPGIAFYLDAMSMVFMLVVTGVGFLIHLYSVEYMADDESFSRFFTYMNLFVFSMLILILGDNLLLLYLGWEGVGLCSYLLIGFWYKDPENGRCARKAFIVTRVGDTAMALGLFLLFWNLGTLDIQKLLGSALEEWQVGNGLAVAAAALLLGGAVGKSAQLPLQTWLPDAMAGPTPVSALIHAATMVTAGVYLIARTHVIFELAPSVMLAVAIVGALTLLISGFTALTQSDIKRVLAYSTISQIGYMFLALGVGAWAAGIFHFMTHAFFKALLFLGAGAVILSMHHEQNIFKMGGLRKQIPLTFWTFLIGGAALAALPWVTAGFYSKDLILLEAFSSEEHGSTWLWAAGLLGALMTSIYTFRLIFIVFFGPEKAHVHKQPGICIQVPLVILAFLSITGGFVEFGGFLEFLENALPATEEAHNFLLVLVAAVTSLAGIGIAYQFFLRKPSLAEAAKSRGEPLHRFWFSGWGFDWLYDRTLVWPLVWFARVNKGDFIDLIYRLTSLIAQVLHGALVLTQTGRVRWYALGITIGAILVVAIMRVFT